MFIVKRKIQVTHDGKEYHVTHYHFTGWEDWKLPAGDSRKELDVLITALAKYIT